MKQYLGRILHRLFAYPAPLTTKAFLTTGAFCLLVGCGFNPQTSVPSNVQQCNTLQRQLLFGEENVNVNTSQFQSQAYQNQRYREYNEMHCYQVLQEAKAKRAAQSQTPR